MGSSCFHVLIIINLPFIPLCCVLTVNNENPPLFIYIFARKVTEMPEMCQRARWSFPLMLEKYFPRYNGVLVLLTVAARGASTGVNMPARHRFSRTRLPVHLSLDRGGLFCSRRTVVPL